MQECQEGNYKSVQSGNVEGVDNAKVIGELELGKVLANIKAYLRREKEQH